MPSLKAPLSPSRLLMLPLVAALLVLLPAAAQGDEDRQPRLGMRHQPHPFRGSLDVFSPPVRRAAQTAVNYFNFQQGSPNALWAPGHVKKATLKMIPGVGRKYFLLFGTKNLLNQRYQGSCFASVFYLNSKPKPAVEVSCPPDKDREEHLIQDMVLYQSLEGNKDPSAVLLRTLGVYGSSFIAWQMSTEYLAYTVPEIKSVRPWERQDDSLEFDYTVLLNDVLAEASLSCHMRIVWYPGQPAQVKYDCSSEGSSSESADGSGMDPGYPFDYSFDQNIIE